MDKNKKEAIKKAASISILFFFIVVVGFIMIKYEIEGEKNLPFKLNKIMIISTADGIAKDDQNISIVQANDLYFYIEKNENNNSENMIEQISIENIKIMSAPKKGKVAFYRPNNTEGTAYVYNDEFLLEDEIIYNGDTQTSMQNLTISNQGGIISFRTCVKEIGEIPINMEDEGREVGYNNDGTLLKKAQIVISDIKYNIGFDMYIKLTDGKTYKGYINISLPLEDVENNGVKSIEKVDMEDIIFKRLPEVG